LDAIEQARTRISSAVTLKFSRRSSSYRRSLFGFSATRAPLAWVARTVFLTAFCLSVQSADLSPGWREQVATSRSGPFPPPPSKLSTRYVFGWSGIEAAEARVDLRRGPDAVWSGSVAGGTKGWARTLWKLDADYETKVAESDWQSLRMKLTENYRTYRTEEKSEFRPGGVRSWRENTKRGSKKPKWKNFYVDGIRDIAGALLLARSQPLRQGDVIQLAVFPGEWMYLVTVRIEAREKIVWRGTEKPVIRASLGIESIEKDYSLKPHKKFQRGTVWVSDDDLRIPLRVEVKVFIGSVFAELVEISTK
jgi:hypothetical protein